MDAHPSRYSASVRVQTHRQVMIIVGLPLIMVILRAHDLKRFPNVIFQLLVPTTLSSAESE
jgi:hypothetical protein